MRDAEQSLNPRRPGKQLRRLLQHDDCRVERVVLDEFEGQRDSILLLVGRELDRCLVGLGRFHISPALLLDIAGQCLRGSSVAGRCRVLQRVIELACIRFRNCRCQQQSGIPGIQFESGAHLRGRVGSLAKPRSNGGSQPVKRDALWDVAGSCAPASASRASAYRFSRARVTARSRGDCAAANIAASRKINIPRTLPVS